MSFLVNMALVAAAKNCLRLSHRVLLPASTVDVQYVSQRFYRKKSLKTRKRLEKLDNDMSWTEALIDYRQEREAAQAKEVPAEPHMLHVVWRVRSLCGRPWWEKDIINKLGLKREKGPTVHKNIPYVNSMLEEVKHLVIIKPLTFPHGLPTHVSDFEHISIKPTGEAIVKKRLEAYEPPPVDEDANDETNKMGMRAATIKKYCDDKRLNYKIHTEYHPPSYIYKKNQDGKEFRYNHNKNPRPYQY